MKTFTHKFVEYIPDKLDANVVYVSIRFALASHLCACGCGEEVVTPLSPSNWQLIFNGETVSLYPSIGNWNFRCRSHYWLKENSAVLIPKLDSKEQHRRYDRPAPVTDYEGMSITDQLWSKLTWWRR